MRIDDIDKLRQQVEEKYKNAILDAEREREEGLKAIEKVWNMLKDSIGGAFKVADASEISYGSLTENIKKALDFVPELFSKNDILRVIGHEVNDNSLAGCLHRLQKQGYIELVEKGKGRAPSKYRKKTVALFNSTGTTDEYTKETDNDNGLTDMEG